MNLLASLGLADVTPAGVLPANKYDGKVSKSAMVYSESKDQISHVITYQVVDGDHDGSTKDEWFNFGTNPLDGNGNHTTDPDSVESCTPSMTQKNKEFYKKRLMDLGVPESVIDANQVNVKDLEGTPVTFGVAERNGYLNVNFAEKRNLPQLPGTEAPAVQASTTGNAPGAVPQNLGGLV